MIQLRWPEVKYWALLVAACGLLTVGGARGVPGHVAASVDPTIEARLAPLIARDGLHTPITVPYGDDHRISDLPTSTPVPTGDLEPHQMRETLVSAGWQGNRLEQAMKVAWCESRYTTDVEGDAGRAKGLFQLHWYVQRYADGRQWQGWATWAVTAGALDPGEFDRWADPVVNSRVALAVVEHSGWQPWAVRCRP